MAKGKSPAFQFYPDAWLSSTKIALMTPAEEGAYIRLLCVAWMDPDCSLSGDHQVLSVVSRLGKRWSRSESKILENFRLTDGRYYNDRLLQEREKQRVWSAKSSSGGKRSGESRREGWLKGGCDLVEPKPNTPTTSSSSTGVDKEIKATNNTEIAETALAVRSYFPGADDAIVKTISNEAVRAYTDCVNGCTAPPLGDQLIAEAVHEAYFKKQNSAGLFLRTVPRVVKSWAQEALRKGTIH